MAQHKHCELIKAWADGAKIQYKHLNGTWDDCNPSWSESVEYRIKPKPMVKKYLAVYKSESCPASISHFYFKSVKEFKDRYPHIKFTWVELVKASVIEVEDDD